MDVASGEPFRPGCRLSHPNSCAGRAGACGLAQTNAEPDSGAISGPGEAQETKDSRQCVNLL